MVAGKNSDVNADADITAASKISIDEDEEAEVRIGRERNARYYIGRAIQIEIISRFDWRFDWS